MFLIFISIIVYLMFVQLGLPIVLAPSVIMQSLVLLGIKNCVVVDSVF